MSKLRIGFSPCPNDTFIFDALIHGKIDTEGLEFDLYMADVEELNQMAFKEVLDVTKLSYHAFLHILDGYVMLDSGSAVGNNCGPLLIKNKGQISPQDNDLIAIPGHYTTANFLLSYAFPQLKMRRDGAGTIGLTMLKEGVVGKLVGVDISKPAIQDAKINATKNGYTDEATTKFIAGPAEKELPTATHELPKDIPIIAVVDPARDGLHGNVIKTLKANEKIQRLVYVSCNPTSTLIRDAGKSAFVLFYIMNSCVQYKCW